MVRHLHGSNGRRVSLLKGAELTMGKMSHRE
jgi:hypothetical protein